MATLHIVRNMDTGLFTETVQEGDKLLLIQDGVFCPGPFPCEVSVAGDDLTARAFTSPHPAVSYEEIRDLMLAHERVVLW